MWSMSHGKRARRGLRDRLKTLAYTGGRPYVARFIDTNQRVRLAERAARAGQTCL